MNISNMQYIPNNNIELYYKLFGDNNLVYDRCYTHSSTKKTVSKIENKEFKYKILHSTTQKGERYLYSNNNKDGLFDKSKIMFGDSGINNCVIDFEGKIGCSEHIICLKINSKKEGNKIKNILENKKFKDFINACSWSNYQINWKIFKSLKNFDEIKKILDI